MIYACFHLLIHLQQHTSNIISCGTFRSRNVIQFFVGSHIDAITYFRWNPISKCDCCVVAAEENARPKRRPHIIYWIVVDLIRFRIVQMHCVYYLWLTLHLSKQKTYICTCTPFDPIKWVYRRCLTNKISLRYFHTIISSIFSHKIEYRYSKQTRRHTHTHPGECVSWPWLFFINVPSHHINVFRFDINIA